MKRREKRKPRREKKESPPDSYALSQLLRERKPVGGWIEWGKNVRRKGVLAA
jgi:hypothetical protein